MNVRSTVIVFMLLSPLIVLPSGPGECGDRTQFLSVCQELVSSARSYEARAAHHNRVAKSLMIQIENMARLPKNQGTTQVMDSLFNQYEENRALEQKFRQLYREATEESKQCMKSAE